VLVWLLPELAQTLLSVGVASLEKCSVLFSSFTFWVFFYEQDF